ncbi:unnamed protein product [Arabidopsis arenosa]|uniref:K-box domain-containing protein n=1 Tax=Arabidopsis arenosa TaxID=38785 RepID=A0A8S2B5Z9_ARAAE|nr:unnamed protein product [Arabidopsis arenosa]
MAKILSRFEIHQAGDLKTLCLNIVVRDQHKGTSFFSAGNALEGLRQGSKLVDLAEKTQDYLSHKELLEIVQSKLEEAKGDNVSIESLTSMEEQLKSALSVTRARKTELLMELVKNLQDKEKLLKEENKVLASQMEKLKKFSETEDERALSPENSSDHNPPETLPLLK